MGCIVDIPSYSCISPCIITLRDEQTGPINNMCMQEGFRYHHAEPTYLMLVYWIPEAESTIPVNASHRVRVGAVVLNHNKEVLRR